MVKPRATISGYLYYLTKVGAAERVNKVRWGVAGEIAAAWFLTIPATGLVAAVVYWLISSMVPALIQLF